MIDQVDDRLQRRREDAQAARQSEREGELPSRSAIIGAIEVRRACPARSRARGRDAGRNLHVVVGQHAGAGGICRQAPNTPLMVCVVATTLPAASRHGDVVVLGIRRSIRRSRAWCEQGRCRRGAHRIGLGGQAARPAL